MKHLYIGLMSGTSVDGIDAALVSCDHANHQLINHFYLPYSSTLRQQILGLCEPGENEIERVCELDILLGKTFAKAVNELLKREGLTADDIRAIGSHGQTIRHAPNHSSPYTLQIADPNTIAAETGITTIADFRRKDIAHGGQGAPLVPAFHRYTLASSRINRAIVNIGGIANVTLLNANNLDEVIGFDTGPGNVLLDAWIDQHLGQHYDDQGQWASTGQCNQELLNLFLADNYFHKPFPKSTGREYFNLNWLEHIYQHQFDKRLNECDVQATLLELTTQSILNAIQMHMAEGEILICGGGAKNIALLNSLKVKATPLFNVATTDEYGMPAEWIEAMAFAWLAFRTIHQLSGNIKSVTGAKQNTILGAIYYA